MVTFLKNFFPSYRPLDIYLAFFTSKTKPFPPCAALAGPGVVVIPLIVCYIYRWRAIQGQDGRHSSCTRGGVVNSLGSRYSSTYNSMYECMHASQRHEDQKTRRAALSTTSVQRQCKYHHASRAVTVIKTATIFLCCMIQCVDWRWISYRKLKLRYIDTK